MKVYGCYLQDETESHYLPKEAKGFMFAPKDITPWQFEGKDDLHGIDYSGMQEQSVLGSVKATRALYGMSGEVHCVAISSVVLMPYGPTIPIELEFIEHVSHMHTHSWP